jgi:hypothetical protein
LWGGGLSLRRAYARAWRASEEWTVTLVADTEPGPVCEQPVAYLEGGEVITPASVGLSIAEGTTILAAIQTAIVNLPFNR